jgi:hypothetical protein
MKTESSSGLFRRDVPVATSIPHEYLAGIREWLDSPPIEIEASERRKTLKQESGECSRACERPWPGNAPNTSRLGSAGAKRNPGIQSVDWQHQHRG